MSHGVALDHEPTPAAQAVPPQLAVTAARIIAKENVFHPRGVRRAFGWAAERGVSAIDKLGFVARAAMRTWDQQHGVSDTPALDRRHARRSCVRSQSAPARSPRSRDAAGRA